ncbi:alginate biosynthesis protein Alg44 [Alcanivorax hongdengensis A-11-3]|uniref:Alginate biosynthesis protein Alg44 n=1 Tax=Alcanivorax hongdengensis A-11-3 TaxID=1177179 RepID=L0WBT7_9GAMM|nr:PilZ domain-containing protein [Alcanivorax hongdengensis]EKF74401.1 alginate biosynthesis protein Alg44 [Alcanivorax hongdengensis A-11-3]
MEEKQFRPVHESQEERQYVRVQLKGSLRLRMQSPVKGIFALEDVSLGGLAFNAGKVSLPEGTLCHAEVVFRLGRANLAMPISFKVIYQDPDSERVGGQFTVIDQKNSDLLRLLIGNYLAGELTALDDVIDNMTRDNYVSGRKKSDDAQRRWPDRLRALFGSLVFFALGLAALTFMGTKLYQHLFEVKATQAWVALEGHTLMMPQNGYVQMLIEPQTTTVAKGQPLLTVSSQLVARLNKGVLLNDLSEKKMRALVDAAIFEVTLNSPCDCEITRREVSDGEYVYERSPLLTLVDSKKPPRIEALFDVPLQSLPARVGEAVTVRYVDGARDPGARISALALDQDSGMIRMTITPQRPLASHDQHQPVAVTVQPTWLSEF